jgi:hypothetical protein
LNAILRPFRCKIAKGVINSELTVIKADSWNYEKIDNGGLYGTSTMQECLILYGA